MLLLLEQSTRPCTIEYGYQIYIEIRVRIFWFNSTSKRTFKRDLVCNFSLSYLLISKILSELLILAGHTKKSNIRTLQEILILYRTQRLKCGLSEVAAQKKLRHFDLKKDTNKRSASRKFKDLEKIAWRFAYLI